MPIIGTHKCLSGFQFVSPFRNKSDSERRLWSAKSLTLWPRV